MTDNIHSAIQALIQSATDRPDGEGMRQQQPVITISRDEGALGDEIAHKLAERLKIDLHDRQIIDRIAERMQQDRTSVAALDEAMGKVRDMWLYSLLTGRDLTKGSFKRHLINVVLSFGRLGGVIVGRGGHLVLANVATLRVRITGSAEACAQRYAEAHGIDEASARKHVEKINHERGKFIWDVFHERSNSPITYDLEINTDRFNNVDAAVDMLVTAMDKINTKVEV